MSSRGTYRGLTVWQKAMDLAEVVYEVTRGLPKEELYGLCSQARRSAVSVPANIAEGYGRDSRKSFIQFLRIAQGSLKELETHLLLAQRLNMIPAKDVSATLECSNEVGKMLRGLIASLNRKLHADP